MCDTVCVSCDATADGMMLFAKNSDRQRNESQAIELHPRSEYPPNASLKCTYISIAQGRRTHAVLLSRPYWMWGAEMGVNEHGVVVGNEALLSKRTDGKAVALTGMDLVRLALERSSTAAEAVRIITTLLRQYGQGGDCGHLTPFYYDNGFLIADAGEAYVLETVGPEWLLEKANAIRAISNCYSIDSNLKETSSGLGELVRSCKWGDDEVTDYPSLLADRQREELGQGRQRMARLRSLLQVNEGKLRPVHLMRALRDHGHGAEWSPQNPPQQALCLHARSEIKSSQTTAAWVSQVGRSESVHWVTGTAAPCISIFKPVWLDVPVQRFGPSPDGMFDPTVLWWRHERLHRMALATGFSKFLADIESERDELERRFQEKVSAGRHAEVPERARIVEQCWGEAQEAENRWLERIDARSGFPNSPYGAAWHKLNRIAGLSI